MEHETIFQSILIFSFNTLILNNMLPLLAKAIGALGLLLVSWGIITHSAWKRNQLFMWGGLDYSCTVSI